MLQQIGKMLCKDVNFLKTQKGYSREEIRGKFKEFSKKILKNQRNSGSKSRKI